MEKKLFVKYKKYFNDTIKTNSMIFFLHGKPSVDTPSWDWDRWDVRDVKKMLRDPTISLIIFVYILLNNHMTRKENWRASQKPVIFISGRPSIKIFFCIKWNANNNLRHSHIFQHFEEWTKQNWINLQNEKR